MTISFIESRTDRKGARQQPESESWVHASPMPSRSLETSPWDFGPVLDFIDSDSTVVGSPTLLLRNQALASDSDDISVEHTPSRAPRKLGSFTNLWEKLGMLVEDTRPIIGAARHDICLPKIPTHPTPPLPQDLDPPLPGQVRSREPPTTPTRENTVELTDVPKITSILPHESQDEDATEDPFAGMTKRQRRQARKQANSMPKTVQKLINKRENQVRDEEDEADSLRTIQSPELLLPPELKTPAKPLSATACDYFSVPSSHRYPLRSRSNVGAKIRPPSPVQTNTSTSLPSQSVAPTTEIQPSTPAAGLWQRAPPTEPNHLPSMSHTVSNPSIPTQILAPFPASTPTGFRMPSPYLAAPVVAPALQMHYAMNGTPYVNHVSSYLSPPLNGNASAFTPTHFPINYGLVPSTVQPIRTGKKSKKAAVRTLEDRHFDFLQKLMTNFSEDKRWLVSPMRLSSDKMSPDGIHVFVDASNILIGFKDTLKRNASPPFDITFDCLALLLERRRPVAKRVYAGSNRISAPITSNEKFSDLAGAVGYEQNIYEQVFKAKELTERQKFFRDVDRFGYAKAVKMRDGSGSDSETGAPPTTPTPKWVEQGVDESLHLKMCQSILDCDVPSTMVLATGDGAGAEFSDGFLAHVERALKKGWKVELVSWKQQTNNGYRNKNFRNKWGDMFKIIELDEYLEYMIDASYDG